MDINVAVTENHASGATAIVANTTYNLVGLYAYLRENHLCLPRCAHRKRYAQIHLLSLQRCTDSTRQLA